MHPPVYATVHVVISKKHQSSSTMQEEGLANEGRHHLLLQVASPNNIHYSKKLRNYSLNEAPLYVPCKNSHPRSKSLPIALQRISNWSALVHHFSSAGKNIPFKDFYKISLDLKVYATFTMRNRFLGVQISLTWVVFAVKTVILLWQPVKSWDIARGPQLISKTNIPLLIPGW